MAHQRAGVDFGDDGNSVCGQELARRCSSERQLLASGENLAHHQAFDVGPRGFAVVGVGAVVADLRDW